MSPLLDLFFDRHLKGFTPLYPPSLRGENPPLRKKPKPRASPHGKPPINYPPNHQENSPRGKSLNPGFDPWFLNPKNHPTHNPCLLPNLLPCVTLCISLAIFPATTGQRRTFSVPAPRCENNRPPLQVRLIFFYGLLGSLLFPYPFPTRLVFAYRPRGINPNRRRERQESPRYPVTSGGRWLRLRSLSLATGFGKFPVGKFLILSL